MTRGRSYLAVVFGVTLLAAGPTLARATWDASSSSMLVMRSFLLECLDTLWRPARPGAA